MTTFDKKLNEYINKYGHEPKRLYIGTYQRLAMAKKLNDNFMADGSLNKYNGLEIIDVCRQDYFELG